MFEGFGRHAREFLRAIERHKWERKDDGAILFPEQKAVASGMYILGLNGVEIERCPNILPTEGLKFILNVLGNHASIPSLYIGQFSGAYTPIAADTAATFPASASEITSGSEGYTQSTRVAWVTATATGAALNNYASPAVFTMATASTVTVNGVFMSTASAKGATTGSLISASRFGAARTFSDTDEFDVKYQLGLTSS